MSVFEFLRQFKIMELVGHEFDMTMRVMFVVGHIFQAWNIFVAIILATLLLVFYLVLVESSLITSGRCY